MTEWAKGMPPGYSLPVLPLPKGFPSRDKLVGDRLEKGKKKPVSDQKQDEGFKVIDRRPFTAEGEIRKEVVEEQEREARREEVKEKAVQAAAEKSAAAAPADAPKRLPAFENLVRMIGSNAAMVLGAYADPRTGEPVIDPEAARELIERIRQTRCSENIDLGSEHQPCC